MAGEFYARISSITGRTIRIWIGKIKVNPDKMAPETIAAGLLEGNDGNWPVDAATLLIVRHRYWLENEKFRKYIVVSGSGKISIDWTLVREALNADQLDGDLEDLGVLQISASLAMSYRVDLRSALFRHTQENIVNIARAVMHCAGYVDAVIEP